MRKKRILVYPCGTEIGLEVYRSLNKSTHFELIGGSSTYDHGRFVYKNHIDGLPFITDKSPEDDIRSFNNVIAQYQIDFLYPAMDGVLTAFARCRNLLDAVVIAPSSETAQITRSKKKTYDALGGILPVPELYDRNSKSLPFPVFVKPDQGQGAVGTARIDSPADLEKIENRDMIVLEYLPGREYTVDCFTNGNGELVYARARGRKRIKNGISVNAVFEDAPIFKEYAEKINYTIRQKGGWFFQVKEDATGVLKLLEVASRIAGTSAISRVSGVNLPLLTMHLFNGASISSVIINPYSQTLELDRALSNWYRWDLEYNTVYVDYDDTLVTDDKVNTQLVAFLYQCINSKKRIILLTRHKGDIMQDLLKRRIKDIFDKVICLSEEERKADYIEADSIFIDDSFGERQDVYNQCGIPIFDTHMVEGLLEEHD